MSRNLCTEECPECGHEWPEMTDLIGRPLELRRYFDREPVVPGVRWDCECGTAYFMWLSWGYRPDVLMDEERRLHSFQELPADASYYGSFNDEPGGSNDAPRHRIGATSGRKSGSDA